MSVRKLGLQLTTLLRANLAFYPVGVAGSVELGGAVSLPALLGHVEDDLVREALTLTI